MQKYKLDSKIRNADTPNNTSECWQKLHDIQKKSLLISKTDLWELLVQLTYMS